MQRQLTFGGGVSPRGTLLRGQSIIEYVLIIAVIGMVIVFAGPGVAGAIRNQFNLVGNTVNNGTSGGAEGGGASGGGSAGADSATVQAAIAKDAKDWTLDEQEAVAEDIAAKGEASPAYAKAKAAMDAGVEWSIKLTNGKQLKYRIIGINHDDLADGSGKAGLTFQGTNSIAGDRVNSEYSNAGGWEKCELRQKMNSGEIWNLMPDGIKGKVKEVNKPFVNKPFIGGDVKTTSDKLFILSRTEIFGTWPVKESDGTGYEYYAQFHMSWNNEAGAAVGDISYWTRTPFNDNCYWFIEPSGRSNQEGSVKKYGIIPAWCF